MITIGIEKNMKGKLHSFSPPPAVCQQRCHRPSALPAPLREEKALLSKRTHRCATWNAETADISSRSRLTLPLLLILGAGKDSVLSITSSGMCQDHHPSTVQDESGYNLTFKSSRRLLGTLFLKPTAQTILIIIIIILDLQPPICSHLFFSFCTHGFQCGSCQTLKDAGSVPTVWSSHGSTVPAAPETSLFA